MAERSRSQKGESTPGWLASLVGAIFLVSAGFMLGLVVGIVKDEPELVMNHLVGNDEEVVWSENQSEFTANDSSGARVPQPRLAYIPSGQGDGWPKSEGEVVPAVADQVASQTPPVDLRPNSVENESAPSEVSSAPPPVSAAPPAYSSTPRAVSSIPPAERGGFSVQVGAFAQSAPAHKIADDLKSKGYRVYITPSADSRDGRWRVRVGPLSSRERADVVAQQLKVDEQLPTWVLSEGGG